ncbi:MAG: hypothetical protein J07HR59_00906, partial [Halorubrum sp. J07HR59]
NKITTVVSETDTEGIWHLSVNWDLARNQDIDGPKPTDGLILA